MNIEAITNYQNISGMLVKLTDKQFESFCSHFTEEGKEIFCQMRTLHKLMTNKEFYNRIECMLAKLTYAEFNSNN